MMLENWCWTETVLKNLSCHYTYTDPIFLAKWESEHQGAEQPPKTIPSELVESLTRAKNSFRAMYHLRQL